MAKSNRLWWVEHVLRMDDSELAKKIYIATTYIMNRSKTRGSEETSRQRELWDSGQKLWKMEEDKRRSAPRIVTKSFIIELKAWLYTDCIPQSFYAVNSWWIDSRSSNSCKIWQKHFVTVHRRRHDWSRSIQNMNYISPKQTMREQTQFACLLFRLLTTKRLHYVHFAFDT